MSDLISRQDAIDAIHNADTQIYEGEAAVGRRNYMTKDECCEIIDSLPSAQKNGEWNFEESPDGYYHSECSECGHWFYEDAFLKPYNYCPNCGADMRGGFENGRT